jgi:MoxR-like ATPase
MMKVIVKYPDKNEEQLIIRSQVQGMKLPVIEPVVTLDEVNAGKNLTRQIYIDEKIERYIVDIVFATRFPDQYNLSRLKNTISYGASPRASINLALAAKAHAFMQKRGFVIPDDIKTICADVMRHRIGLTYEAEAENITQETIISEVLRTVNVP